MPRQITSRKRYKNVGCIALIKKMIVHYRPDVLVLYDCTAKGICRQPRIKELHGLIVKLARQSKLKVPKISGIEMRQVLLGDPKRTKQDIAELLAKQFPDELASRLPPKRKCGHTQDRRIDIFDAVALAVVYVAVALKKQLGRPNQPLTSLRVFTDGRY